MITRGVSSPASAVSFSVFVSRGVSSSARFRCTAGQTGFFTRLGRLIKEKAKSDVDKLFSGFSKTHESLSVVDELLLYWNLADTDRVLDELEEVAKKKDDHAVGRIMDSLREDILAGKLKSGSEIKEALKMSVLQLLTSKGSKTELQLGFRGKDNKVAECILFILRLGNSKKQHNKPSGSTKTKSAETEIPVSRLDIRVGLIKKVQKHPDADSLYVEEIDVGEESPRTVVSGLVKYIPLEEMQNRKVCVLCNLKPATMRGIKSQAMVLDASNDDHTKVELVDPPSSAKVGERVTFLGYSGEPDSILNAKSKVWEKLQADLQSNKELVACYKDVPFTTSAGVCKVSSITNGAIR
ncbi:hypothetical protein ZIOFF_023873 [Zingiber officinale]|uniref:tRNA-binding domain-containing protein n=1 Tax=Zingiber officinale TaxID=94328 RepID=A0A8J5LD37_ZINOF|nr:hypothetical protein ZIOFF_023873 [Zingiber officinale]